MMDTSENKASAVAISKPMRRQNSLPMLLGAMVALALVAVIVWMNRPVPENAQPPPAMPKTVAEVQKEIEGVKADKAMPESNKKMVLGYLEADLKTAKEWEGKKIPQ